MGLAWFWGRPGSSAAPHAGAARRPYAAPVRLGPKVAISVAAFAVATVVAEAAGAANLGTALGIGQVVFAVVLVALIVFA